MHVGSLPIFPWSSSFLRTPSSKLTQKDVDGLVLPVGNSERFVSDTVVPGLGVRLRAGGSRTYVFQYKLGRQGGHTGHHSGSDARQGPQHGL